MSRDTGYDAVRQSAGLLDQTTRGRILARGADRRSFLQGLLTNDIDALTPGTGCYAAYLTPQGRLIADMKVQDVGDAILLDVNVELAPALVARFEELVFSEDVQFEDVTARWAHLALHGPDAAEVIVRAFEADGDRIGPPPVQRLRAMAEFENGQWSFAGAAAIVSGSADFATTGFDIYIDASQGDALRAALLRAGASAVSPDAAHVLRVEAGRPLFGVDMDSDTLPLETDLSTRAISFTKGCYVGQEVIVRVMHRGHGRVAHRLVGLTIDGEAPPPPGTAIVAAETRVGEVTSSARSPLVGSAIALGYVRRDLAEPGTAVSIDGQAAVVTTLPFV